ncbi:MAG: hypothetical protein WD005_05715 [Haliea sp.]
MDNRAEHPSDANLMQGNEPQGDITVDPIFVLLFSVQLTGTFNGFPSLAQGITPLTAEHSEAYDTKLSELERHVFGEDFAAAGRTKRWPLGRISIRHAGRDAGFPPHADVYLVTHATGTAIWEAWFPGASQPLDALRWIEWLDPDVEDGLPALLWRALASTNGAISGKSTYRGFFPLSIIRTQQAPLEAVIEKHGEGIVRLLLRSRSMQRLRPDIVRKELSQNYCVQEGGLTLTSRRSGLDLHGRQQVEEKEKGFLPLSSALPFLISIESLLIERTVLETLYGRLSKTMPKTVEDLLTLKQQILDGLEEYYGAITKPNRIGDEVAAAAEPLLGIDNLYHAVMTRLDAVSFAITTRYQKRMTVLQFWLTLVFGATEIGFIASGIATWHYETELSMVLAWTVGTSVVAAIIIASLLRGKLD